MKYFKYVFLLIPITCLLILSSCEQKPSEAKYYTVKYYIEPDIVSDEIIVKGGTYLEKPIDPVKEGHEFVGWYTYKTKWDFGLNKVEGDTTLTAFFKPKKYTITFETFGGTYIEPIECEYDKNIVLPTCEKEDFEFACWIYNNNRYMTIRMPDHDITVEAGYRYNSVKWKLNVQNNRIDQYKGTASKIEIPEFYMFGDEIRYINTIQAGCFSENKTLEEIYIPDTITKIEWSAFNSCTNLKKVRLSQNLTEIRGQAFAYCTSLKSIEIPSGVTNIQDFAFMMCTSLEEVIIPSSVEHIVDSAFSYCNNVIFYVALESAPSTWDANWNNQRPVYYNFQE